MQIINARSADVGGIPVARILPERRRRLIGPWCFLDHAGPVVFASGSRGMQVGPHPHTCLQTFTWMIEGEVLHRDNLGHEQLIRPGQVNLMTAGHGISHTEQTPPGESRLHAAQLWIALPFAQRHVAPRFDHYPELPGFALDHLQATLLTGDYAGYAAPTLRFSPIVGVDLRWQRGGEVVLPLRPDFEYGIVPLQGSLQVAGETLAQDTLAYLPPGKEALPVITGKASAGRALLIGGLPMSDDIQIWWNFVGHSREEIIQAQQDWQQGAARFGKVSGFDGARTEAPPLPW